nr:hypothetical protein [Tanacetum cinerariifolium]
FFIFDDVNIRISPVSKMPFRKKPRDFIHERSKSNMIKSSPRTMHKWLPKLKPLAEPIAKRFPRVKRQIDKISKTTGTHLQMGCSKHMTSNRALLMNFVEKFLRTIRYGNNDFAVIAGYGDVVIGPRSRLSKVYMLFRNEDGVYFLTGDRSSNLYTIALNEVASNSSTCLLAKASSQSWLWHQRLSHLNFATINNLVKNNLVQGLPKMKFEKDHLCSACEQRKIHRKHYKSKTDFASNKPLYLLHMDLYGLMRVQSLNGKRYVLVVIDEYSGYTWRVRTDNGTEFENKTLAKFFDEDVGKLNAKGDIGVFVGYSKESDAFRIYNKQTRKIHESVNVNFDEISKMPSKQFSLEPGLSKLNETGKYSNPSVLKIMKSSTINVETPIIEEVFHEISESFQGESSLSSLNDDVQQSPEEVILYSSNTQSILINMIPNGDEASTSHNVFNERLEDAYFNASTSFHDLSNVHTYYQPYPHEKKWTKDHPFHKIIGDPKSSVRTRGQLANSCLLRSIEPANVAEALRDAN